MVKTLMGLFLKENFYGLQFSEINNIANCYPLSMFRDFIQIAWQKNDKPMLVKKLAYWIRNYVF